MPKLYYRLQISHPDSKVPDSSREGWVNLEFDGSYKSMFVNMIANQAGEAFTHILKKSGAFDRQYLPMVPYHYSGYDAKYWEEVKAGVRKHPDPSYVFPGMGSSCSSGWPPTEWIDKDSGQRFFPAPAVPIVKIPCPEIECDCGGPKGHVVGGIWCRK